MMQLLALQRVLQLLVDTPASKDGGSGSLNGTDEEMLMDNTNDSQVKNEEDLVSKQKKAILDSLKQHMTAIAPAPPPSLRPPSQGSVYN